MADILKYVAEFQESPSGYFARTPIVKILTEINEVGGDATEISGYTSNDILRSEELFLAVFMDQAPTFESQNAVNSGGLFEVFGDVKKIDSYEPLGGYDEEEIEEDEEEEGE